MLTMMSATDPIEGVTLDDYIRARARLESAPDDVAGVVAMLLVPDVDAWRRVDRAWRARTEQNQRLAAVVSDFLADQVEALRAELERGDRAPDVAETDLVRQEVPTYLRESAAPADGPSVPAPPAPVVDLDLTQPPLRRLASTTLPFVRGVDVPDAVRAAWAEVKQTEGPRKEGDQGDRPADEVDETAFLSRSLFTEAPRATPFEAAAPASASAPPMPMEEYAAFLAELSQDPGREGFLRAKYGIEGEQAQRAIGAAFAALFQRDPAQRARFDALLAGRRATSQSQDVAAQVTLTMERYASISAALASGASHDAVLARFGLRPADWSAAMRDMSERLAADPHLRVTFRELVARAREQGST